MTLETLGQIIRREREKAGLSRTGFSKRLGIVRQTVARVEDGIQPPRFNTLVEMLEHLGLKLVILPAKYRGMESPQDIQVLDGPGYEVALHAGGVWARFNAEDLNRDQIEALFAALSNAARLGVVGELQLEINDGDDPPVFLSA